MDNIRVLCSTIEQTKQNFECLNNIKECFCTFIIEVMNVNEIYIYILINQ